MRNRLVHYIKSAVGITIGAAGIYTLVALATPGMPPLFPEPVAHSNGYPRDVCGLGFEIAPVLALLMWKWKR